MAPHAHQATRHRPFRLPPEARPQAEAVRLPSPCGSSQRSHRRNTSADPFSRIGGVQEPAPLPERPRIVTASRKTSTRFGPVQDIDAEEHQRRGDAAVALFREIVRRATRRWQDVTRTLLAQLWG